MRVLLLLALCLVLPVGALSQHGVDAMAWGAWAGSFTVDDA